MKPEKLMLINSVTILIMNNIIGSIQKIDLKDIDENNFSPRHVGCIVLSHDNKIVLQQRDQDAYTFPNCLATFGGRIEESENPMDALVRELNEELGAKVDEKNVISLGTIIEHDGNNKTLIYVYFWQDKENTITGCYEGEARYYENKEAAFAHPKIMEDVKWLLFECDRRGFFKK